jgi:uncharacterized repeat protein (TIGR01451 family)
MAGVEARGNLSANARVTGVTPAPGSGGNSSTAAVSFLPTAGLVVTKTSDADTPVNPGDTVNYTVTVTNDGPAVARSVRLTDAPSAWLEDTRYNSGGDPDDWGLWIENDYVPLPDLNPGQSRQILFKGRVTQAEVRDDGGMYNFAAVSSDNDNPPQRLPSQAMISVDIAGTLWPADLTVSASVTDTRPARPGQTVEFQVICGEADDYSPRGERVLLYTPPPELTDVEFSPNSYDGTWTPWPESNQINVPVPYTAVYFFRGKVAPDAAGSIDSVFYWLSDSQYDPDLTNNAAVLRIPIEAATLSAAKRSEKTAYYPGDEVRYFITVENNGPAAAIAPVVSDTLPDSLQNPRYSLDGGLTDDAWTGSVTLPLLPRGAVTLLLLGTLGDMASGSLDSTVTVRSDTINPDGGANIVEANTVNRPYVVDTAILTLTKESDKTEYFPGEAVTYTIKAANSGAALAKAPAVTDALPAVIQNPQYSIGGEPQGTWTGTAALPDIVPGGTVTLTITGILGDKATGSLANTATAVTETVTPTGGENRVDAVTANNPYVADTAVLTAVKASDKTVYRKGEAVTYTVTVVNTGAAAAKAPVVSDALTMLENGAAYSIDGVPQGTWTDSATLPDIAPGGQSILVISGAFAADVIGTVANTAAVESDTLSPTGQKIYIEASAAAEVAEVSALTLSLAATAESPLIPGKRITYDVLVYNGGPAGTVNLRLEYTPPPELTGVQYAESSGQWLPWPGTLPLGELISGGETKVQVRGTVAPGMTGAVVSTFTAAADNPDTGISDNTATSGENITGTAALTAAKTADKARYQPGERIAYTITVNNAGPATAIAPTVTDRLPALILNPQYSIGGGSETDWPGSATLPDIAPGGTAALVVTGTLAANAAGSLANTANVTSATLAPDGGNNSVNAKTSDSPYGDPSVGDTVPPATVSRCQAVTDLIQSVALQEAALSHILNAEGEKMQKIIQSGATQEQLLELNDSVFRLVSAATRLEMIFQSKLEMFTNENPCAPPTA